MTPDEAADMEARARAGLAAVVAYLGTQPETPIEITDMDPAHRRHPNTTWWKRIYGPGAIVGPSESMDHPVIEVPVPRQVNGRTSSLIIHELTHAVAGSPHAGNRLLAEGLAMHVNGVFAPIDEDQSFANVPIHSRAFRLKQDEETPMSIEFLFASNAAFAGSDKIEALSQAPYIMAASFVTYLIQKEGPEHERAALKKFMEVYRNGCFECVYRKPLEELEEYWLDYIAVNPAPRLHSLPAPPRASART